MYVKCFECLVLDKIALIIVIMTVLPDDITTRSGTITALSKTLRLWTIKWREGSNTVY